MRGKAHNDQTKAAVMACLIAGQGLSDIAKEYNLPLSTVKSWKNEIEQSKFAELRSKRGEQLDDLLFGYVTTVLSTLTKQAVIVGEESYVRKQPADSLAILHGVMADKAVRILEAAERASGNGEETAG